MMPQIIYLCLLFGSVILHLAKHGKSRGKYNGFAGLISEIILFLLLKWGGFFDVFGW